MPGRRSCVPPSGLDRSGTVCGEPAPDALSRPTVSFMSRRLALGALSLALLLGSLAACTDVPRIPPPEPAATSTPLFATDEEALEAATASYEEYLAASGEVTSSADLDIAKLRNLVTEDYLAQEEVALQEFSNRALRTSGESALQSAFLQQRFEDNSGFATVVIYACVDVSSVKVLDNSGLDVTPADRPGISALEVEFTSSTEGSPRLLVSRSQAWAESSICD